MTGNGHNQVEHTQLLLKDQQISLVMKKMHVSSGS